MLSAFGFSTNAVQLGGLTVFAISAGASTWAASHGKSPWRMVAWLQIACFCEVLFGVRHLLHDAGHVWLTGQALYTARHAWQVALTGLLVVCALFACAWLCKAAKRGPQTNAPALVALAASGFTGWVFLIEIVSLHLVDSWLYAPLGPFKVISLLWAAAAVVVCICALIESRR